MISSKLSCSKSPRPAGYVCVYVRVRACSIFLLLLKPTAEWEGMVTLVAVGMLKRKRNGGDKRV